MNLERIATLLSSGLKPSAVASIVGCSPARISQLLKDSPDLQSLIAEKEAELLTKDIEDETLAAKYHAAENALIQQILDMAPSAELKDVTNALKVVSERQEKRKARINPVTQGSLTINQTVVSLSLPKQALPALTLNAENEIISINERTLAPLASSNVEKLFQTLKQGGYHESKRMPAEAEGSSAEALPQEVLTFLNSREPAPYYEHS